MTVVNTPLMNTKTGGPVLTETQKVEQEQSISEAVDKLIDQAEDLARQGYQRMMQSAITQAARLANRLTPRRFIRHEIQICWLLLNRQVNSTIDGLLVQAEEAALADHSNWMSRKIREAKKLAAKIGRNIDSDVLVIRSRFGERPNIPKAAAVA